MVSSAYVLINCELGYEDQTVDELSRLPRVEATRLDGAYDIIATIHAESKEKLEEMIRLNITKIDRILSTLTLTVIAEED